VPELQSRLITGLAFTATDWLAGDTLMRPTPVPAGVVTIAVAVLVAVLATVVTTEVGPVMVIVPPTPAGVPMFA
jgi:hypothetical protein